MRPQGDDEEEVNQSDLRLQLNQQDLCQRINNRHHQRDVAEREQHRQYDEEHDVPDADHQNCGRRGDNPPRRPHRDYEPGNNLNGISSLAGFGPSSGPPPSSPLGSRSTMASRTPRRGYTYSITVRAACGYNDIMAAYFPVMMGHHALN